MISVLSPRRRQSQTQDSNYHGLKRIILPPSIHKIETASFADHTYLQSVSLPKTISTIGRYAFRCCTALTEIYIPPSVSLIDYGAFMGCTKLSSLNIPQSVDVIQKFAFSHCTSLISVTLPSSSTKELEIHPAAFSNCTSLVSVAIPDNCIFVIPPEGYNARNPPPFGQCRQLERKQLKHNSNIMTSSIAATLTTSLTDSMNTWLQHRFHNLPLHQLCYDANVTIDQIQNYLSNHHMNHNNNYCDEDINMNTTTMTFETTKQSILSTTDLLNMTPLHVLCCNPNVKPEMILLLLESFATNVATSIANGIELELQSESTPLLLQMMEASNQMTPMQLYLSCNGCSPLDLFRRNNLDIPLEKVLEKGFKWNVIEIILAFQKASTFFPNSLTQTQDRTTANNTNNYNDDDDDTNGIPLSSLSHDNITNKLNPFMKAAMLSQCDLNVVYQLTLLYGVDFLMSISI